MSRLKRQRLTETGHDQVTATGDDTIGAEDQTRQGNAGPSIKKEQQQRSLFVRSLPASTTTTSLTSLFSESYPLKHATVVIDPVTKQSKGYGFVTFADVEDAQSAKEAFDGFPIEGRKIKVELAKPRTRQGHGPGGDETRKSVAPAKGERNQQIEKPPKLIVRNLPWTIKDADQLALLFRSFGKVKFSSMPKKGPGLSAGFGFVVLRGRKNAEKALQTMNGKDIEGRTLAVDWAVDKDTWENLQRGAQVEETQDQPQNGSTGGQEDESVKSEGDGGVAIDALPQSEGDHSDASEEDYDDDDGGGGLDEIDEEDEDEDEIPPADDGDDKSSTLFIRNLPFTTTDDSLREHFNHFGAVRYARVVLDQATERSKGVAFVCFYDEQDADACIRSAPRMQPWASQAQSSNQGAGTTASKQSLLQDPSVDRSGHYTLEGRVLQLSRAVDRREATRLTFANSSLRDARDKDKRRLYLLSEGTVLSNSPLYDKLSPAEVKMREDSAKQRASLIKTNPTLHLSLTRLSVRNLPRSIDSKALKALAREGAVGFAKDVKAGFRKQLTKEELSRGGDEMREAEQARKSKGKGIVKQAKVVFEGREGAKVAEDSGAGRSRGYGFIEYSSHRWALMGLRWLNAHAVEPSKETSTGPNRERKKRLIVEFAIENAQVVLRRQENEAKARETSRIATEKLEKGELPARKKDWSKDQLMAKTRKGTKMKQDRSGKDSTGSVKIGGEAETEQDKLAKRQQIIGRKRMIRRNRAKA